MLRLVLVCDSVEVLSRLQVLHEVFLLVIVVTLLFRWLVSDLHELSHLRRGDLHQERC